MSKIILESIVSPADVSVEYGGCSKTAKVSGNPKGSEDVGLYVRLTSWAEENKHTYFDKFVGHRVRVTIETLD